MFKKTLFITLSLLLLGLTACSGNPTTTSTTTKTSSTSVTTNTGITTRTEEKTTADPEPVTIPEESPKILVAYFSATNNTEAVARTIANHLDADLYKIMPVDPYTEDDLRYYSNSRSDKENADPDCRPAIVKDNVDISKYDVIFLGYPIWFGEAPKVIYTFMESYDFKGIKIVPFCTSSSSGIGNSDTHLHALAEDAVWVKGERFPEHPGDYIVNGWVDTLKIK